MTRTSKSMEELSAPQSFRAFGFVLVGVVLCAFFLMLVVTLVLKGWSQWSSTYVRSSTWLVIALWSQLAAPLTDWYLKRRSVQVTQAERTAMLVAARAVSVCFFVIGICAIANA